MRSDRWKPDNESAFDVGVSINSDVLEPEDLEFLEDLFGPEWGAGSVHRHRPKSRPGSGFHIHLENDGVESASENVIAAAVAITPELRNLLFDLDPSATIDVHARQDLPAVGEQPSVVLAPQAIGALVVTDWLTDGFDIDQYGAEGHPILRKALEPIHTRRWGYRYAHRLLVESADGASLAVELDPESEDDAAIVEQLRLWRAVHPGPVNSCVSEQVIRVPGNQGIGMHIERGVLNMIHDFGVGLELRARTTFSLTAAPHRRPSKS